MTVLIYGGGAVGLGLASFLLNSRVEVDIIARENTVAALRVSGLLRKGLFGSYHVEPQAFHAFSSLEEVPRRQYDYILVCTKSFDSLPAAQDLARNGWLFGRNTRIVLFQNGWGNAEIFASMFDTKRIYSARVITGFRRPAPNEVMVTVHADAIHIGSLFGGSPTELEELCELVTQCGIACQVTDDIGKDLWAKMLYNCALNPLSAVLDVPYGALAANGFTKGLMNGIVEEIFAVMAASGYQTHWVTPGEFLTVFYGKLVPDTAEHKSSTLQDILAHKKTEIDALNGAVIKMAAEHQIAVPYNTAIYSVVKFLEAKYSPCKVPY